MYWALPVFALPLLLMILVSKPYFNPPKKNILLLPLLSDLYLRCIGISNQALSCWVLEIESDSRIFLLKIDIDKGENLKS